MKNRAQLLISFVVYNIPGQATKFSTSCGIPFPLHYCTKSGLRYVFVFAQTKVGAAQSSKADVRC